MGRSYRELLVWQKAKSLAVEVYRQTEGFPKSEIYGLTSQLRRAGVSVASNIAEGQGRLTPGEFCQFLGHARGSLLELARKSQSHATSGICQRVNMRRLSKKRVRYSVSSIACSIRCVSGKWVLEEPVLKP